VDNVLLDTPALQHGTFVFGVWVHGGDAVQEGDLHLVAVETAGHDVVMWGFVEAHHELEDVLILPCAAGGDLELGAGLGRAAVNEPRRCAGQTGLATLPAGEAGRNGVFGLCVAERDFGTVVTERERNRLESEVVGVEFEGFTREMAGEFAA